MAKIITIQTSAKVVDVSGWAYKYVIRERAPIKLSNGMYLHVFKATEYNNDYAGGDFDEECDAFYNEQFN
jgi:hypothetical protein